LQKIDHRLEKIEYHTTTLIIDRERAKEAAEKLSYEQERRQVFDADLDDDTEAIRERTAILNAEQWYIDHNIDQGLYNPNYLVWHGHPVMEAKHVGLYQVVWPAVVTWYKDADRHDLTT
jgi:hypothetical protein